jgi:tetratricopeptide (TPR) repeat protein
VRLSAAIIVRDEADRLARCLASIRDVVDEIVVVDTGSVDDTPLVAAGFDAVVLHRPWDDDFSAARNHGLDHVTGDWVLYIDSDEYLAPVSREHVERELVDHDGRYVGMRLRLRHRSRFTAIWEHRLWRNRPDIRFSGVIHESHLPSLREVIRREGLHIGQADLLLEHDGYEGDLTHKHRRNLPLLEEQVHNDPERTYLWTHIGRARKALGDHDGAMDAWRHAVELIRRNGVRRHVDCLAYLDLIIALATLGAPEPDLVAEADERFPDDPLILWAGVVDAAARHDHAAVVERVDRLFSIDHEDVARRAITFDERIVGEWALHARGVARLHLGAVEAAVADLAAAEELDPDNVEYRTKRILAEARLVD